MRILIMMGGFLPGRKYGGPPVSIDNFCSLMVGHECFIVTHDHDLFETTRFDNIQDGWNNRGNCNVLYVSNSEYNKATFGKVIEDIKPNLIYLQGLFQPCILPCLQLAKKRKISVLLAPRGELCEGALNIKKWKKIPYIQAVKMMGLVKNIHWQSTSDEETEAIKKLMKVSDNQIFRLDNIPSIPKKEYPRRKKEAGEGKFVFLSRIHPKKNLLFAINLFDKIGGKVEFDIYGPIEDEEYWKHCQDEIHKLPKNITINYKGLVGHDDVHDVFSQYDAFLFPTLSENYGHVIAESLIVGTPVIISDQTPWRNLEKMGVGWDASLSNSGIFRNAIDQIIAMDNNDSLEMTRKVSLFINQKLNIKELNEQYTKAIMIAAQ